MLIALGSDHAGFLLKEKIKEHLMSIGHEVRDYGTDSSASVDYTSYGQSIGEAVAAKKAERGILVCGTGIGISIAANKVPGIRAAVCSDCFSAEASRLHNDANILALGERVVGQGLAIKIVETFLATEFEGGRHQKRVDLITKIEEKYSR